MRIPPCPTLGEMAELCRHNAEVADWQLRVLRKKLDVAPPGRDRDLLATEVSRYQSDFRHWSDYVGYYRRRAAREGADKTPMCRRTAWLEPAEEPRQQADRRLPREPEDEDGLPF